MQKKSHKIIALILFIAVILGTGFVMYHYKLKGRKSLRKGGYRTDYNPRYVDSMVRAKKKQSRD
jgi:hypothetical protein